MPHKKSLLPLSGAYAMLAVLVSVAAGAARADYHRDAHSPADSASGRHVLAQRPERKRLITWRRRDVSNGQHLVLTSDSPLDDYSSYVESERLLVRIPQAMLSSSQGGLSGHGFADMRVEDRDADVLFSVKVVPGATVRVNQNFNRLEITVAVYETPKK